MLQNADLAAAALQSRIMIGWKDPTNKWFSEIKTQCVLQEAV